MAEKRKYAIIAKVKKRPKGRAWQEVCREIEAYSLEQAEGYFRHVLYRGYPVWNVRYVDLGFYDGG